MGKKGGKAPKGRAAAKQKAKRGNSSGGCTPNFVRQTGKPKYGWSEDEDDINTSFRGFQQANNRTPQKFSPHHASSLNLRHKSIQFVSAGVNTPEEFLPKKEEGEEEVFVAEDSSSEEEDDENAEEVAEESTIHTNIVVETEMEMQEAAMSQMNIESPTPRRSEASSFDVDMLDKAGAPDEANAEEEEQQPLFVVDTVGDDSLASKPMSSGKQPVARSPSPTPSNSSEEVVVFQGRNNQNKPIPSVDPNAPPIRKKFKEVLRPAPGGGHEVYNATERIVQPKPQPELQRTTEPRSTHMNNTKTLTQQPTPKSTQNNSSTNSSPQPPHRRQQQQGAIGWGAIQSKVDQEVDLDAKWAPAPAGSWWKGKSKKARPDLDMSESEKQAIDQKKPAERKVGFAVDSLPKLEATESTPALAEGVSEEEGAEKSIATLQADWNAVRKSKRRARRDVQEQQSEGQSYVPLSTPTSTSKRRGKRGRKKDNRQLRAEEEEEAEDAEEAAYDDYMSNLAAQQLDGAGDDMFTTARSSAFGSSLVIDGEEVGDDEVLSSHYELMNGDDSSEDEGPIGLDTSELSSNMDDEDMDLSDLDSSDLEDELEYTEKEQWEDEEDLRQRRYERMTDEQLARLFAKQQELGYDGDDLIIDDGEYVSMSEVDGIGDIARARAGLANIDFTPNGSSRRRNRKKGDFSFPSASAFADTIDQYGDDAAFDIMEFDRPSLRPTKKGRKGNLPADLEALSDEELKENMRTTWANDRRKKSAKKAERESLRMEGLLGTPGRQGKADLGEKYPMGMTRVQIHEELRIFLQNDGQQSRPFPPMDKADRKALHEIASVLKLSSKSVGSGKNRFPVLNKTQRTHFTPEILDRAIAASQKGFLGHGSKGARALKKENNKAAKRAGAGGGMGAASLKNGEVVGAGAAELGKENFGHRLMEKMGWSKGMALGKEGEGRLLPVQQTVRLGTAGLG